MHKKQSKSLFVVIILYSLNISWAQMENPFPLEKFKSYTELTREVTYAHLNKSTLLKGEMLGFTVYTFLKDSKNISGQTNTIYCTISNKDGKIIKKKMLLADRGIAYNTFNIDSLFTSGDYIFRAYTNWMLNFDEKNHFETLISVIDPEIDIPKNTLENQDTIDIQILPEGGHLIESCQNFITIIAKDQNGIGIPNLKGTIVNETNEVVGAFKLNQLGIGKTVFVPTPNNSFSIKIEDEIYNLRQDIDKIDKIGFNISALERTDKLNLCFRTNVQSLDILKDEIFKITLHNGKDLKLSYFSFNGQLETYRTFEKSDLFTGINIITVFDKYNKPILERMFFNYDGISTASATITDKKVNNDSLQLKLSFNKVIDTTLINNLSISILPSSTKSYNFNSNIASKIYLEPYINTAIENGAYYFENITQKTKYDLDNLLISQGWSSYSWNSIFNETPVITHNFDRGVTATVHLNDKDIAGTYMTYPIANNKSQIFELGAGENIFTQTQLYPLDNESYQIVKSDKKAKAEKPKLYVQFSPSEFTLLNVKDTIHYINPKTDLPLDLLDIEPSWEQDVIELDEVIVKAKIEQDRLEKISSKYFGRVDLLNESIRRQGMTFAAYINTKGFIAQESFGTLTIQPRVPTSTRTVPLIFLDDIPLSDFSILYQFNMALVDYIIVNSSGFGEGLRGGAGVIRIFTNPEMSYKSSKKKFIASVPFPVSYAAKKIYYTPKYKSFNSRTFKEYGIVDWIPNSKPNTSGEFLLNLNDTDQSAIILYIEGVLNESTLVSEKIKISLE